MDGKHNLFDYLKDVNPAIKILLFTNSLVSLASFMLGPIYALFVVQVGGDILDAGIAVSIYALAAALTTLISGIYSDKVKENELIMSLGYLIMGFSFFLFIFVKDIWFLFIVQAIMGFGEAIYGPAFNAIYSKHLSKGNAGKEWSFWQIMDYFTRVIGAAIGAYLVSLFGFQPAFIIMTGFCVFSAVFVYILPRKAL
ncbi:MAG: MFS transporter [Candidatus Nanoarchaeia archaeon]|nr:MFS transporter [Candidatus Nanoarchaeia archaeon]